MKTRNNYILIMLLAMTSNAFCQNTYDMIYGNNQIVNETCHFKIYDEGGSGTNYINATGGGQVIRATTIGVQGVAGYKIQFVATYDIEPGNNANTCEWDWFELYRGTGTDGVLLTNGAAELVNGSTNNNGRFCNVQNTRTLILDGNAGQSYAITMKSDVTVNMPGFEIDVYFVRNDITDTLIQTRNVTNNTGAYVFNNKTYTTTGVYQDTMTSVLGCDSIFNIDLTMISPIGPGGINSDLYLWLRPETGVSTIGNNVTEWENQVATPMNTEATKTANTNVVLSQNAMNYNPGLVFDGTNSGRLWGQFTNTPTNPMTTFIVLKKDNSNNNECCTSPFTLRPAGAMGLTFDNSTGSFGIDGHGFTCGQTVDGRGVKAIVMAEYQSRTNSNGAITDFNGVQSTACTNNTVNANTNEFEVGGRTGGGLLGRIFAGTICEIAYYNSSSLTSTEIHQIESYYAIKYGIAIGNNYVSSSNVEVYDISTFSNNIVGIGRDDDAGLLQRQSRDNDDSLRVYLNTLVSENVDNVGSFSSNNQFVLIGHDGATIFSNGSTEFPAGIGIDHRVEREWKVTNTGFDGTYSLDIKTSAVTVDANDLRLLVDTDSDLSDGTLINPTFTFNNGVISIEDISTTDFAQGSTNYFTIVSMDAGTILPVDLLSFSAVKNKNEVNLFWSTASEQNSDYFEVEHSMNTTTWKVLEKVNAAGNSQELQNYSIIDSRPMNGDNYYRLKQVDQDGAFEYSAIRNVNVELQNTGYLYPNPTNGIITLRFLEDTDEMPTIYDLTGQKLNKGLEVIEKSDKHIVLNTSNLEKGTYLIMVNGKTISFTKI